MTSLCVTINNSLRAMDAAEWCESNNIDYNLEYWGWPNTNYKFLFKKEDVMMVFLLKWK